jgi:hypothetical protein
MMKINILLNAVSVVDPDPSSCGSEMILKKNYSEKLVKFNNVSNKNAQFKNINSILLKNFYSSQWTTHRVHILLKEGNPISLVFQNIDPPSPSLPGGESVLPPQQRGVHTRLAERGMGGSIFWKTREIGLPSYSKICTLWSNLTNLQGRNAKVKFMSRIIEQIKQDLDPDTKKSFRIYNLNAVTPLINFHSAS